MERNATKSEGNEKGAAWTIRKRSNEGGAGRAKENWKKEERSDCAEKGHKNATNWQFYDPDEKIKYTGCQS